MHIRYVQTGFTSIQTTNLVKNAANTSKIIPRATRPGQQILKSNALTPITLAHRSTYGHHIKYVYFSYVATVMNIDLYAYCLSFTHSCKLPTLLHIQTMIILPRLTGLCSIGLTGSSSGVL